MSFFSRATLQLSLSKSSPFLRGAIYFFLSLILVGLAAEMVARSPLGNQLPAPSVQGDSFLFDAKVYQLEQQVRRDGGIDCIFIGSSVTNSDIDPAAVERIYRERSGETIHCFNLGYPAMTIENAAVFAEAVIDKFSPRLIVYTFLPRDLTDVTYTVDFLERSAWFGNDSLSPHAWLVSHSYAYRYYQTWRYLLLSPNRSKRLAEIQHLTDKGFQPTYNIREPYPEINLTADALAQLWQADGPRARLEKLLARQTDTTRILLIEGPIFHEANTDALWQIYESEYIPPLEELARDSGVTFIRSQQIAIGTPREHWYDHLHFNYKGALTFSEWLGGRLAEHRVLFE